MASVTVVNNMTDLHYRVTLGSDITPYSTNLFDLKLDSTTSLIDVTTRADKTTLHDVKHDATTLYDVTSDSTILNDVTNVSSLLHLVTPDSTMLYDVTHDDSTFLYDVTITHDSTTLYNVTHDSTTLNGGVSHVSIARSSVVSGDGGDIHWGLLVLVALIIATAVGNLLVCLAISWERRLRTMFNFFLMSLAISDLLVSLLVMPLALVVELYGFFPLTASLCVIWVTLDVLLCTASIWHMCTISMDRYLAIRFPLKYGRFQTKTSSALKILFVWVVSISISLAIPIHGFSDYSVAYDDIDRQCAPLIKDFVLIGSVFAFYFPFSIMIVTYCLTIRLLRRDLLEKFELNMQKTSITPQTCPAGADSRKNSNQKESCTRKGRSAMSCCCQFVTIERWSSFRVTGTSVTGAVKGMRVGGAQKADEELRLKALSLVKPRQLSSSLSNGRYSETSTCELNTSYNNASNGCKEQCGENLMDDAPAEKSTTAGRSHGSVTQISDVGERATATHQVTPLSTRRRWTVLASPSRHRSRVVSAKSTSASRDAAIDQNNLLTSRSTSGVRVGGSDFKLKCTCRKKFQDFHVSQSSFASTSNGNQMRQQRSRSSQLEERLSSVATDESFVSLAQSPFSSMAVPDTPLCPELDLGLGLVTDLCSMSGDHLDAISPSESDNVFILSTPRTSEHVRQFTWPDASITPEYCSFVKSLLSETRTAQGVQKNDVMQEEQQQQQQQQQQQLQEPFQPLITKRYSAFVKSLLADKSGNTATTTALPVISINITSGAPKSPTSVTTSTASVTSSNSLTSSAPVGSSSGVFLSTSLSLESEAEKGIISTSGMTSLLTKDDKTMNRNATGFVIECPSFDHQSEYPTSCGRQRSATIPSNFARPARTRPFAAASGMVTSSPGNEAGVVPRRRRTASFAVQEKSDVSCARRRCGSLQQPQQQQQRLQLFRQQGGRERRRMSYGTNEGRATKVLGVMFVMFVVFWLPFFTTNVLSVTCERCAESMTSDVMASFVWLGYLSSLVNPIIYTMFSRSFRDVFYKIVTCRYRRRH